jgi:tetratricopeptide (TPR) repeat protein
MAYAKLEDPKNAAENFNKAITAGNREPELYVQYAESAAQNRDYRGIMALLEPRAAANVKNAEYQYYLATAYDNLGQRTQAIQYYQRALEAGYRNTDFLRSRINTLRQQMADES